MEVRSAAEDDRSGLGCRTLLASCYRPTDIGFMEEKPSSDLVDEHSDEINKASGLSYIGCGMLSVALFSYQCNCSTQVK